MSQSHRSRTAMRGEKVLFSGRSFRIFVLTAYCNGGNMQTARSDTSFDKHIILTSVFDMNVLA